MNLIRREPVVPFFPRFNTSLFREFDEMSEKFNKLFTPFTPYAAYAPYGKEGVTTPEWTPLVDIQETEKEYLFKAELPEVKKDDVKVTIQEGMLTIEGERKAEKEEKGKKFHRTERFYGKFVRTFAVPVDAEETNVTAEFKEGVLVVRVPKSEKLRPKTISVKVAS